MAQEHRIDTPRGSVIQTGRTTCRLEWSSNFSRGKSNDFRTSMLEKSGLLGTVVGSGEVKYIAPYARFQYYSTAQSRIYDPRRGGMWFERMKAAHRKDILRAAEKG